MTFVRVSGAGDESADTTTESAVAIDVSDDPQQTAAALEGSDSLLMLDQENLNRLENVLSTVETKDILGEVLANPVNNPNESLGDFLNPSEVIEPEIPQLTGLPEVDDDMMPQKPDPNSNKKSNARRKSQRQIDRELKEEAEKIRKENQEQMKKENEAMQLQKNEAVGLDNVPPPTTATGR